MEIEDVLSEWKKNSKIDESRLLQEIIKTPSIHSQFLEYFLFYKRKLISAELKYNKLTFLKRKYYRGEMTKAELDEREWQQYQGLKPSGSELNSILAMDPDLADLEALVNTYKANISVVEYIMKQIGQRDYSLKSAVDIQKYLAGN